MYKWEEIVQKFTSTWEIKPVISLLYKPNVYFESLLYIDTLVSFEEVILLSEKFECFLRNELIQCHLSKCYFTCPYCKIVCRENGIDEYRSHSCEYSRLNCEKVNTIEWDYVTVSELIAKYKQTHYNYPGKYTTLRYDRSFEKIVVEQFGYQGYYMKYPGEITTRLELEDEDNAMTLMYDNFMKEFLA
jgi:hypothetical protein